LPKSETSLNELLYDIRRLAEHRENLTNRKIEMIYRSLERDLNAFIANVYVTYSDEEGRLYISYLDAKNRRARFLQEIVENVDSISIPLKNQIMLLVEETYTKSYEGMLKAFKKAYSATEFEYISKDIAVNPNVIKQALNNNISKLTLPAVMEIHRNEIIYQIQQELNIGLMQGDRYERMAKRISERVGVSRNKAMNIVRTETHRNVESGFMDCAERLQKGLDNSNLIYAATWRTMKDERVRPQIRRKTKKGWKTSFSKNNANHMKMEGITVKAGELFDLGNGVKAKAPSKSGVAAHDCNCRCFLEYNLMTVEEFAKTTGRSVADRLTSGENGDIIKETTSQLAYKKFSTGEEVNQFFGGSGSILQKKKSTEGRWFSSLSLDEKKYISDYCADGYGDINDFLRKSSGWENIGKEYVENAISSLDSAIKKFELTENITVHRGVRNDVIEKLVNQHEVINDLSELVGKIYEEPGYSSTTALFGNQVAKSKPTVFEFDIPAGKGRGAYVNKLAGQFKDIEYEFLIKRGAKFKITAVEEDIYSETYVIKAVMEVE